MKTLWILALAVIATAAIVAASGPADSGQAGACSPTFEIRDPELRALFAKQDRGHDADFVRVCSVYRADLAVRRGTAQ